MIIIDTHIVPENIQNIRLSDYAIGIFETIPTRKGIVKAIKKGAVLINGEEATTGRWVQSGQTIQLTTKGQKRWKPYRMVLDIIYEDDALAVVHKPAGIVVSGNQFRTIQNALAFNLKPSKAIDALPTALAVHRLDYSTSGLLLVAKTGSARRILGKQFERHEVNKQYHAVVIGRPPASGIIDRPIDNKIATTIFQLLYSIQSLKNKYLSLLTLAPITGRTHQLRVHLSDLGYPILGDKLYGRSGMILKGKGLFLCATGLEFIHPTSRESLDFKITIPSKFKRFMEREQKRWKLYTP